MNVSEITNELKIKIEEYLTSDCISDTIFEGLSEFSDDEFQYNSINNDIWDLINDNKIKQAIYLYTICSNDVEVSIDSFSLSYNNHIISEDSFSSIIYSESFISNNNKPIFMLNANTKINSYNKDLSLFFAKALLDTWDNINYNEGVNVFFPNCSNINNDKLISFIKLIMLSEGKFYHSRVESDNYFLDDRLKNQIVCPIKNYVQYKDILNILSEYNNTKDILQKYLLLYTILENFMYRKPIAESISNSDFTIRKFKELYKNIEEKELPALKKLFTRIYNDNIFLGINTKDHIELEYNDFLTANSTCSINFLQKIPFQTANIKEDFARLIYLLRNCIVHNKETEFHLTHFELNKISEGKPFFEKLILPLIENIVYSILLNPNSFLDYNSSTISLYEIA